MGGVGKEFLMVSKVAEGCPRPRNSLRVQELIECGDHIHEKKPIYSCVTGIVTSCKRFQSYYEKNAVKERIPSMIPPKYGTQDNNNYILDPIANQSKFCVSGTTEGIVSDKLALMTRSILVVSQIGFH
ncbi:hypothetical protein TNCV_1319591 [Trichonephila clavipes]|nr:hypothetical protein TNCV_1319591 [Trichonephila clavipes]